jgi:NAD(P)-dependent dehydrogenase (short-subunit alcohol dehydrogenase family)
MSQSILITGCSSGIGFLSALLFARKGWQVYATVRNPLSSDAQKLIDISRKEKLDLEVLQMDVTKMNEVKNVFSGIKHLDVLINNAGFGNLGPIEDFTIDEIKEVYETNIYGVIRVCQAAIPLMRNQGSGRIINISSINGLVSFGLYGVYSSSKFALESLSEALRFELAPFGIDVALVEPGGFETKFAQNSKRPVQYKSDKTHYKNLLDPLSRPTTTTLRQSKFMQKITNPQIVVDLIYKVATTKNLKMRYLVGLDAYLYNFGRKILPYNLWLKLLRKAYNW